MTTISDLSRDLIGKILSKVAITCVGKVRCTWMISWSLLILQKRDLDHVCMHVPFHSYLHEDTVALSSVGEEKLAALYQCEDINVMEIWVTTNIDPHTVSWSKLSFLAVNKLIPLLDGSFFIDEEKKLALVFTLDILGRYKRAYIIGEDEYFKQVDLGEAFVLDSDGYCYPLVCSYVPSLVQINQGL